MSAKQAAVIRQAHLYVLDPQAEHRKPGARTAVQPREEAGIRGTLGVEIPVL